MSLLRRNSAWVWAGIAVAFAAYLAMIVFIAPWHEPWADEAVSWLIARNCDLYTMYFKVLRYEGHPGLWYTVLWVPIHLFHLTYRYITWYSAAIACFGIAFFLVLSPFPVILRMLIPFTFYLGYQYSIIARSYVLFPLLVFAIAYVYRDLPERRVLLAVLLGLLANMSFHGTLMAVGLLLAFWIKARQSAGGFQISVWKLPTAVFALFLLFTAVCLWPARNAQAPNTHSLALYRRLSLPITFSENSRTFEVPAEKAAQVAATAKLTGAATPAPRVAERASRSAFSKVTLPLTLSYGPWVWLGLAYQLLFIVLMVRSKNWMLLLPFAFLFLFLVGVYSAFWHLGLVFVLHLALLWIVWEKDRPLLEPSLQNAVAAVLLLLCVSQFSWTYRAVMTDRQESYSAGKLLTDYIRRQPAGTALAGFDRYILVLPYFDSNIYWNNSFRGAMNPDTGNLTIDYALATMPTLVVISEDNPDFARFFATGYKIGIRDCSVMYVPNAPAVRSCMDVLKHDDKPSTASAVAHP